MAQPERTTMAGNDTLNNSDSGSVQYVYLDFDGERTRYNNQDLKTSFSVTVRDPGFTEAQKKAILSGLNEKYSSAGIVFTTSKPSGSYSTLYYGQCDPFSRYGDFFAVSETCDTLNKRSDDNAFVLLDSTYSTDQIISVSAQMTDMLTGSAMQVDSSAGLKAYASKTYMLSTNWNQQDPYNKYCPVDPATKKRSVAGCTNIAEAQVIYYWIEQGKLDLSLTLESSDAYTENGITIDEKSATATQYGYLSFAETNKLLANFTVGSSDSIAALCFAAGVVQEASYSSTSTATPYLISLLTRAGFGSGITEYWCDKKGSQYFKENYGGLTDAGYNLLIKELLAGRPVLATLYYGSGKIYGEEDHAVVIDGYNSSTDEFHVNFGWGAGGNKWISREELNDNYGICTIFTGVSPNMAASLSIQSASFKASAVNRDDDVTLSVTVSNTGKRKSNQVTASFSNGRRQFGSASVDSVSAGGSCTLSCTFSASSLSLGSNTITVRVYSSGSGRAMSTSKTVKVYDGAVTSADNTWKKANEETWTKFTAAYDSEGIVAETVLATGEYVGYCDTVDFREVTLEHAGKYTFTLTGATNDLELTLYSLTSKSKLQAVKTVTVTSSTGKLSNVPLESGTYYISVRAVNAESHGDSDYALSFSGTGYLKGNNLDDWEDMVEAGPGGGVVSAGAVDAETTELVTDEWVGLGDRIDYRLFWIEDPAKASFTVTSTGAAKFVIYELQEKTDKKDVVTYSLKKLQTTKIKAGQTVETKGLLLPAGNGDADEPAKYYFSMESTNAAKGGSADYSVSFNPSGSVFYTEGFNDDDWTDVKTAGAGGAVGNAGVLDANTGCVIENWVGFCDAVDYVKITIDSAAKLSFLLGADDAAKFTVWKLNGKTNKQGDVSWSLKSLQAKSLAKVKKTGEYAAATKALLLDAGEYYISMQSTNAAKGGNASYAVTLDAANSVFYTDVDDGRNDWLYDKKTGTANPDRETFNPVVLTSDTKEILLDAEGTVSREITVDGKTVEYRDFVGYGDAADYARILLDNDATVSFSVAATDKAKFVIYSFIEGVDKKGNAKYTVKALQTTELKKAKTSTGYTATTKALSLQAGEYYVVVQSTNAAKGGCAYYNVELNMADCSGLPDAPAEEIADASDSLALDMPRYAAGTPENMVASAALDLGQIVQNERNSGWLAVGSLA